MIFFKKFIFSLSFLLLENIYLIFIYSIGDFLSIDLFYNFLWQLSFVPTSLPSFGEKTMDGGLSELIP